MRSSLVGSLVSPLAVVIAACMPVAVSAQYSKPKPVAKPTTAAPSEAVGAAVDAIWANLIERGDVAEADAKATALLVQLAQDKTPSADLIAVAGTRRLVGLIGESFGSGKGKEKAKGSPQEIKDRATFLRDNPTFAASLAWTYIAEYDNADGVFRVIKALREANAAFEQYPELAAAVALVHDGKDPRSKAWTPAPARVMELYSKQLPKELFSAQSLPAVLLAHVVDVCVSESEIDQSRQKFAGQPTIGKRYFDVKYDTQFFKYGRKKAMDGKDYTLANIIKYGGVCVEQAYYAEQIAKSIGVPSATIVANGDDVGHAWVGYLRTQSGKLVWDLTEGRYKDYKGEAASARDPQTGRDISDGELQMKAERASFAPLAVRESIAIADAAMATPDKELALKLMERAVNACPYVASTWERMAELAGRQALTAADLEKWGGAIVTLCGSKYPDFAARILEPLIGKVESPAGQASCWKWAREKLVDSQKTRAMFRHDLAVKFQLLEGDAWLAAKDPGAAWNAYRQTIKKYGKETPAVQAAAERCEKMLVEGGKPAAQVAAFWKDAWDEVDKPKDMSAEFAMGSNWSVFGLKYASWLERSGDAKKAANIRKSIVPEPKKN